MRTILQRQHENNDGNDRHLGGGGSGGDGSTTAPIYDAGFYVGPPRCYPTSADLTWHAGFEVLPLPAHFDSASVTDYIYFNLVFG